MRRMRAASLILDLFFVYQLMMFEARALATSGPIELRINPPVLTELSTPSTTATRSLGSVTASRFASTPNRMAAKSTLRKTAAEKYNVE